MAAGTKKNMEPAELAELESMVHAAELRARLVEAELRLSNAVQERRNMKMGSRKANRAARKARAKKNEK